jgi:hypothetical protein
MGEREDAGVMAIRVRLQNRWESQEQGAKAETARVVGMMDIKEDPGGIELPGSLGSVQ